ncbi:MAG: rubrerythrin [Chloroflexi bacterium]|nr:rubrerythrin [Chloroflexota bacterium]
MDWLTFLKVMAMDEEAAYKKYQLAASLTDDEELKALLERLRDEEEFHAQFLLEQYNRLQRLLAARAQ